jgi:hypothetical protein
MIQCRVINCTDSPPSLVIVTVYRKNHCWDAGLDRSGAYSDRTWTRTPRVVASDVDMVF